MGMKPQTTDDVFDLTYSYVTAAALVTAMELGLFWRLDEGPMDAKEVADQLHIPYKRCLYWLQLLQNTGLLDLGEGGYVPSSVARSTILDSYSQRTWSFLARETLEHFPAIQNLTKHIREPGSSWVAQGLTPPDYVAHLAENLERAELFTRMLYELHQPMADEIAATLELSEAERLLDLGGGSGVISHALLRKNPKLTSVVVDIPNVCAVGRNIAKENGMEDRLTYMEANFLEDDLPSGFDVIMQCDVGEHDQAYLHKLGAILETGGRLVLVDQFESDEGVVPEQYKFWAFLGSMADPDYSVGTLANLITGLNEAGFRVQSENRLRFGDGYRWDEDWVLIEAHKA
jgi:cyclopropane fatty-acyl-phospholipid synthase-like methyltransferase